MKSLVTNQYSDENDHDNDAGFLNIFFRSETTSNVLRIGNNNNNEQEEKTK